MKTIIETISREEGACCQGLRERSIAKGCKDRVGGVFMEN
jgi:hypothetical protein